MNRYFGIRVFAIVCILGALGIYQSKAIQWKQLEEENEKQIALVEKYNKEIREQEQKKAGLTEEYTYADGVFQGSAEGFGGAIVVEVEISSDEIRTVNLVSADGEDKSYLSMAKTILDTIVEKQTIEVDTVSGATYSSKGIINATKAALETSKKQKEKN